MTLYCRAPNYPSRLSIALAAACLFGLVTTRTACAVTAEDLANYRDWGLEVASTIENDLRRPHSYFYAEQANLNGDQFGGINGYAFIWADSVEFRARNSLFALDPSSANRSIILGLSDKLYQGYWLASSDHENGYVVAPGSTDRYYDDNAHMTVALMEAYELTGEQRLLDRAVDTHDFVLEGEDSYQGGGIYFREGSFGNKNTISTLQEARGAAMIYQATGQQRFLDDATRLLQWTNSHVKSPDGLYYQEYRDSDIDDISNVSLTNGAGMGILTNLEMYDITQDESYLQEAQQVGIDAANRFWTSPNGPLWGGGYWAFELVDAWDDLYHHDGSQRWLTYAARSMEFLKANIEDNNGHYGRDWHTVSDASWPELNEWYLIDQAAVARGYPSTGLAQPPALPGDFNNDGTVDGRDFLVWQGGESPDPLSPEDLQTWQANYGTTSPPVRAQPVPEPSTLWGLALTVAIFQSSSRRRGLFLTASP